MSKKRGPTPKRKRVWMAKCEECGEPNPLRDPNWDDLHYTPCAKCANPYATYFEMAV